MNGYRLAGDIGGTNARFALLPPGGEQLQQVRSLYCRDYPGPGEAVQAYLDRVKAGPVTAACFAGCRAGCQKPYSGDQQSLAV